MGCRIMKGVTEQCTVRLRLTESYTPIHTGGGMIESHLWIEIPLKLENQIIQIKTLVCELECPHDTVLGCTSLAQLLAWQDYASR